MALNKFMHSRNIYKHPPDFVKLAKSFVEFSNIAKVDVTGKVSIDFKDPHSLRVLTKCLLKSDFDLDVIIPEDRLVPTLPLRLNYILWIEDLMEAVRRNGDNIKGLDIGTGACAIYPLLGAVKNKWRMVGTETDEESIKIAKENVENNNLQDLIEVKKNPSKSIIDHVFADGNSHNFDFCMCNPPFYSNVQELCESRSPARLPPKNGFTGSPHELITEGGELTFCRKMIEESKNHQDRVTIFTTMVGHKFNLRELMEELKGLGVNYTTMEFCQGRVTRWGLAWTYQNYAIDILVPGRDKPRKKNVPLTYILPDVPGTPYDVESVGKKVKSILEDIKIVCKVLHKKGKSVSLDIIAVTNTWSNQRRMRRLMKKNQADNNNTAKLNAIDRDGSSTSGNKRRHEGNDNTVSTEDKITFKKPKSSEEYSKINLDTPLKTTGPNNDDAMNPSHESPEDTQNKKLEPNNEAPSHTSVCSALNDAIDENTAETEKEKAEVFNQLIIADSTNNFNETRSEENVTGSSCSKFKTSNLGTKVVASNPVSPDPVVHAFIKVVKKENDILLELDFLDGTSGKEGLHQIAQYIKNNWK